MEGSHSRDSREHVIVSCNHAHLPGHLFCGICGEALDPPRCSCGFVVVPGDSFCGHCGAGASKPAAANDHVPATERRFDLEHMAQLAAQEKLFLETTDKARVTQDDIRKLLAIRRKKF